MSIQKYSVIMPVFNCERFVSAAISSMLKQVVEPSEIIVVDDCSTDRTVEIASEIRDRRIRIYKNVANCGVAYSLNKAISLSSCEILMRMDGDDFSLPRRSCAQLELLCRNPSSVVGMDSYSVDLARHKSWITFYPTSDKISKEWLSQGRSPICHPSAAYAKDTILSVGGYDTDAYPAEDIDCWFALSQSGVPIINTGKVGILYRIHSESVSSKLNDKQLRKSAIAIMRHSESRDKEISLSFKLESTGLSNSTPNRRSWVKQLRPMALRAFIDDYQIKGIRAEKLEPVASVALLVCKALIWLSKAKISALYLLRYKRRFMNE